MGWENKLVCYHVMYSEVYAQSNIYDTLLLKTTLDQLGYALQSLPHTPVLFVVR